MGLYLIISLVFFMHALILHSCLSSTLSGNETDRLALLEIKRQVTADPSRALSSWNESNHFCHWQGVICGRRHQRVTILDLNSMQLAGSISPHVGNLSFLKILYLQNNTFSQKIPPEIGRLHRLKDLYLSNNSLGGEIPSNMSGCSQLVRIAVSHNMLVGRIPEEIGTLSKLSVFSVHSNHLTGSLPNSFRNLSSLTTISANTNNLSGSIPDIFGQLSRFNYISLDLNRFSGTIPPSLYNVSSLRTFAVSVNNLQGTLPSNFGLAFPFLENLGMGENQFTGPIPVSFSNASNLVRIGFSLSKLHGQVPSLKNLHRLEEIGLDHNQLGSGKIGDLSFLCDLTNATSLLTIAVNVNNFGGRLPECIANLSSLFYFHAYENKISGSIPNGIVNLAYLESLTLYNNKLTGHIPTDIGKLSQLYLLDLEMNSLSGNLPSSFGNLSHLAQLFLNDNNFQGQIPSSLAECRDLEILSLSSNNLSGNIPPEVISLPSSFVMLDLSQNHFSGSFPVGIGKLINLEYLNISGNMLSGGLPASLGGCIRLETLSMQGNLFQGSIPSAFSSLRGIQVLDLSTNFLSGTIPEFLGSFEYLHSLNLSHNNFEGVVPTNGVFKNATGTSVQENSKLCGGIPEFRLPKCEFQHSRKGGLSKTFQLSISLVCGILGIAFTLLLSYLYCCLRRERKKPTISSDSENFLKLSYQNLLKATDGFSSANLIGEGSFGSVFKGVLDEGERTVAVKLLNLVHRGAAKSFLAECEALRNIRHRNLLKVLSACSGVDYQSGDFKALIYEYMANGSLEEWLHPPQTVALTNERPRLLSFSQRLDIAIDVAVALDYLHHHCERPIIHCDLKPSNVLLNDNMVAHVGDFGLVRFLPRTSGNQSSSVGVKGTVGYAPPEYGMGNDVWTQGDVYSYGILLLEMFTGRRPTENMFHGTSNLHNFVKEALPKRIIDILDPVLVPEDIEAEIRANSHTSGHSIMTLVIIEESLSAIFEVGVACSAELPRERLDISVAVSEMCRIRNKLASSK